MIKIGEYQELEIARKADFGVYVSDGDAQVLLPAKQVPQEAEIGDRINVFIYRDSSDRLIATVNKPFITLGQIGTLTVSQVTGVGAFMEWGLEKDLFLPYKEQTVKVRAGEEYPVALYLDKSNRLCATMKIYKYLSDEAPYVEEDVVTGTVYNINPEYGVFVAVDNKYHGLIQQKEIMKDYKIGEKVTGRVVKVRKDGKLDIAVRQKAYLQIEQNANIILSRMEELGGALPYTDKSASPERIRQDFAMSKNDFKKAIGRLVKEKRVIIGDSSIKFTDK
ncbi:MAG: S1 RNA-binding domain-containing protein [Lachnospiraceae bacterium]|nr:S1 RNA-binding domain-containing protein [Lachnospiraceae bacterium]